MKTTTIARIGAAGFVVTALALSIVQLNEPTSTTTQNVFVPDDKIDPLRAELRRCRSIGQTAASDTRCLRAWAEQRSRFLMGVSQATGSNFGAADPATSEDPAAKRDAAASSPSPVQDGSN